MWILWYVIYISKNSYKWKLNSHPLAPILSHEVVSAFWWAVQLTPERPEPWNQHHYHNETGKGIRAVLKLFLQIQLPLCILFSNHIIALTAPNNYFLFNLLVEGSSLHFIFLPALKYNMKYQFFIIYSVSALIEVFIFY